MNENNVDFAALFAERLAQAGLTIRKISELTGITTKYLEFLSRGEYHKLPPAPYLRGYLLKLGVVLGFDGREWWEQMNQERLVRASGPTDSLPRNRFAKRTIAPWVGAAVVGVLLIAYFSFRFADIFGRPDVIVYDPSDEAITISATEYILRGKVVRTDDLYINNEPVVIGEGGEWAKKVILQADLNSFEIRARKILGQETKVTRTIVVSLLPDNTTTPTSSVPRVPERKTSPVSPPSSVGTTTGPEASGALNTSVTSSSTTTIP